jgi:hypothetical protein
VAALAQPIEERAGFTELLGPRALGEVAADDDEVRCDLVDLALDCHHQPGVVSSEMEVGKVDQASHDS